MDNTETPVRIIGSRELHQNLPHILKELEQEDVRYVLTVHGKPRAVLVGAGSYLHLVNNHPATPSEKMVRLQLGVLLGSNDRGEGAERSGDPEPQAPPRKRRSRFADRQG